MTKELWAILGTAGLGLGVWILKTVANKNDPERQKARKRVKLAIEYNALLAKKNKLSERIKKERNFVKKKKLQNTNIDILARLSRMRSTFRDIAEWG